MSFNAKDMTQGGQIAFMRLRMFTQISNLVFYCVFLLFGVVIVLTLLMRLSWQNFENGLIYWWCYLVEGFPTVSPAQSVYHLSYYGKTLTYTGQQILVDEYTTYCGELVRRELIFAALLGVVVCVVTAGVAIWILGRQGKEQSEDETTGGRTLTDDPAKVAKMLKRDGVASDIKIEKLPLIKNSEIQNFCLHGTVSTGKSEFIRRLMNHARRRGDMVIVYDRSCEFVKGYYDPSKDKILNPQDSRCVNWDLWRECLTQPDFDNVANTLIPIGSGDDPFWQGSGRTIFAEAAYLMRKDDDRSYAKLVDTLLSIKIDKLRTYLQSSPAANLVEEKIEKTAISIRAVLTNYVKAIRYLHGIERQGEPFTIRDWMRGVREEGDNGWLFISSNADTHASLKPVISMWLSIAIRGLLAMGENRNRRVWIFADELPTLHKIPDLVEILPEARKFGGCYVIGIQSYAQLEDIYGVKAAATLFDVLNTRGFFRSPSKTIAEFAAGEIGEEEKLKASEQYSYGADPVRDGVSLGKDKERSTLVSYSDIQTLPDLSCYITLPGPYPAVKMKLKYQPRRTVAPAFLQRNLDSQMDSRLNAVIEAREAEGRIISKLFDTDEASSEQHGDIAAGASLDVPPQQAHSLTVDPAPESQAIEPVHAVSSSLDKKRVLSPQAEKSTSNSSSSSSAAAVTVTTSSTAATSAGREQEIAPQKQEPTLPPGLNEDGEIVDQERYEEWAAQQEKHSQQAMQRREEININHSRQEQKDTEIGEMF